MHGLLLALSAAVSASANTSVDCEDNPRIEWEVEGGFATFNRDAASRGDALLAAIRRAGGRLQPGEAGQASAYQAIVATLVAGRGGPSLYDRTIWDRAAETYRVDGQMLNPDTVTIRARLPQGGTGQCIWTVDGVSTAQSCDDGELKIRRVGATLRGKITVRAGAGEIISACAAVQERLIVGLGDSYASGEGNPDQPTRWSAIPAVANAPSVAMPAFRDGRLRDRLGLWDRRSHGPLATVDRSADAQWWDNTCHRSLLSQQALAALGYAAADRHRRVLFLSFACSGATVFDGIVGPRFEAPGYLRRDAMGEASPALRQSQLQQLSNVLCAPDQRLESRTLAVPATAPTWRNLSVRGRTPREPRSVSVPQCRQYTRTPDAILMSVGGNDVGFGGVGAWALLPPKGRLPVDVIPTVNKMFGGGAVKGGFGLVCPGTRRESRCRLNTDRLTRELPAMFGMLDDAVNTAGLGAVPVKLQTSYPLVTHAEDGRVRGCFGYETGGELYELLNEPWLPLYASVLDRRLAGMRVKADWLGRWSFGIQTSEMGIIDREVLAGLNKAVAAHTSWYVVAPARMPLNHGVCAADGDLARQLQQGATSASLRRAALQQFGWPRLVNGGWANDRPNPTAWDPYAARARWVRTATDSALTQSVFDGGVDAPQQRVPAERLGEAISGGIHPSLPLHAAMAEQLVAELELRLR